MKKIFLLLIFMLSLGFVNAIDYDNITFTNEEFYNGAVTATKTIELSNGRLAVFWLDNSNSASAKICDLDGTNCNISRNNIEGAWRDIDIFQDEVTNNIILIGARTTSSSGYYVLNSNDLTNINTKIFDSGATNYISALQIDSTDFAIAYQDTADGSKGKLIICKLDGSSCGSEQTYYGASSTYHKIVKTSNNKLIIAYQGASSAGILSRASLTGTIENNRAFDFNTGTTSYIDMIEGSDNKLKIVYRDDSDAGKGKIISCDLDGTNCGSEIEFDDSVRDLSLIEFNEKLFVQFRDSAINKGYLTNFDLNLTSQSLNSLFENDDSRYTDMIINSNNELVISYGDVTNSKGEFAISEVLASATAIKTNLQDYYNTTTINVQVNTTTNTNLSYIVKENFFIDCGGLPCIPEFSDKTSFSVWTNQNTSTINLNLSDVDVQNNSYGVLWYINGDLSQNLTQNFTIDTINPIITNNLPTETNSYLLDFNSTTCSDTNLNSCTLNINSQNFDLLTLDNGTITDSGYFNYTITATDLAGNQLIETGQVLINPRAYLYFESPTATPITNFTLDGNSYVNYAEIPYYNDIISIGANSLQFEALGYAITNIDFNISSSSTFNQTFEIQNSKIVLKVYDFETGSLVSDNIDITLIETNYTNSFSGGEINISDVSFYDGEYQILLESSNYETESVYFTYTNKEILNVNAYLIPSNSTTLGVLNVKVQSSTNVISNQLVNLLAWDSSSSAYITVGQSKTDSNGDAFFNVELGSKVYKVQSTRNGETQTSPEQIIKISGTIIYIIFGDSLESYPTNIINSINYNLINTSFNATHDLVTLTFNDENNLVTQVCLDVNRLKGSYRTLLSSNCLSTSSGEIQIYTSINNSFTKEVRALAYEDNEIYNLDNIIYQSNISLERGLANLGKWFALIMMLSLIALGVYLENIPLIGLGSIIGSWVTYTIFSNTMSYTIPLLITIVMLLTLYGTFKKRF